MTRTLHFLAASDTTKLAKHYALSNGVLEKSSYPNVFNFDSYPESIRYLPDLHRAITEHAALGHCLLKGELQRPLKHESRAGSTNTYTPTSWIALDFDGIPGVASFEELAPHLPPELRTQSYIEQYSASSGIEPDKGYSAHIFMLLETEVVPTLLKEWLLYLNLATPFLRQHIRLNAAKTVLRWPLDITACQNDKLLYISPPSLEGLEDGFTEERIHYVRKPLTGLTLSPVISAERNRTDSIDLLNELRKAAGLPAQRYSTVKHSNGSIVLKNPTAAQVTGWKHERGFCYLNLNGGDSWGYYHPEDAPAVLHNFKGEPAYAIKDFLPEYYPQAVEFAQGLRDMVNEEKKLTEKAAKREERAIKIEQAENTARKTGFHYLAINDPKTDTYYRGTYDANTETLDIHPTRSKGKLEDFLKTNEQPALESIPDWTVEYNFDSDIIFDADRRFINLCRRTEYLRKPTPCLTVPPTIAKLLHHVLGSNEECVERFLNWLACIVQYRTVTLSAWVLSGTQGTGKGVLFHQVLTPLLGRAHVHTTQLSALQRDYNGFMERAQIVLIDEAQISALRDGNKVMQVLKHLITESEITIHRKFQNEHTARNRANFILASNTHDPVEVTDKDRRFNVAPRQEVKLLDVMDARDIDRLSNELYGFAGYLLGRSADKLLAMTPVRTEERTRLQELTTTSSQEIADAIKSGRLDYFVNNWPGSDTRVQLELQTDVRDAPSYDQILDEAFANLDKKSNIPAKYLRALFYYLEGTGQSRQGKFTKYAGHRGLRIEQVWHQGQNARGLYGVVWRATPETIAAWQQERDRRTKQQPHLRRVK